MDGCQGLWDGLCSVLGAHMKASELTRETQQFQDGVFSFSVLVNYSLPPFSPSEIASVLSTTVLLSVSH